jgi:hypothetical protein
MVRQQAHRVPEQASSSVHLLTLPHQHLHAPHRLDISYLIFLTTTPLSPTPEKLAAWTRTSTVADSRAVTIYGGGVNGYNIVPQLQLDGGAPTTGATAHIAGAESMTNDPYRRPKDGNQQGLRRRSS